MSERVDLNDQQRRTAHLAAQVAKGKADIADLDQRSVRGYRAGRSGGAYSVAYAQHRVETLTDLIDQDVEDGDTKHDRVPRAMKLLALFPLATDFIIVGLFLALVFDVSLSSPLETPAETLTALVMATIVTVGLAVTLRWIGTRVREDNQSDDASSLARRRAARGYQALLVLVLALVAAVVLVRVAGDAAAAGISLGTGWVLAIFLAVIIAALNWIIYAAESLDGSIATHELDHWGTVLTPIAVERRELVRKVNRAQEELRQFEAISREAPESKSTPNGHSNQTSEILPGSTGTRSGRSTVGFGQ